MYLIANLIFHAGGVGRAHTHTIAPFKVDLRLAFSSVCVYWLVLSSFQGTAAHCSQRLRIRPSEEEKGLVGLFFFLLCRVLHSFQSVSYTFLHI